MTSREIIGLKPTPRTIKISFALSTSTLEHIGELAKSFVCTQELVRLHPEQDQYIDYLFLEQYRNEPRDSTDCL